MQHHATKAPSAKATHKLVFIVWCTCGFPVDYIPDVDPRRGTSLDAMSAALFHGLAYIRAGWLWAALVRPRADRGQQPLDLFGDA